MTVTASRIGIGRDGVGSGPPRDEASPAALRQQWQRLHRVPAPAALSADFLRRDIAYYQRAEQHGGLRADIRRRLAALAKDAPTATPSARAPSPRIKPGSTLLREWHGRTYTVLALEDGFEMAGRHFASLTEIACHITNARWSGPRFFGLTRSAARPSASSPTRPARDARNA